MKNLNTYKKYIVLIIVILSISFLQAQQLPLLTTEGDVSKKSTISFKENTKNLEAYFSTREVDKKGSGYKPFKRWENHWKHYLQADGTIAPADHLWKAWEQKQVIAKNQKVLFDSNWTDKGPFSQFSKSGQGRVNTVAVDPNIPSIIYAGAPAGGLWKSTNSGVNWIPLTDNLPQIGVSGIAIVPNTNPNNPSQTIYISTGDDDAGDSYSIGVLKSIDGGMTWNQTGTISASSISSNEIVLDPVDSNKIWVATDRGLYLSTDAGVSWTVKQTGHIRDFKLKPGDSNTIYAVSSNNFYLSTDGGTNFTVSNTGLPLVNAIGRLRVEVTPAAPNKVYLLAAEPSFNNYGFEGIFISDDSGASFTQTNENSDIFGGSSQAWYDLAFSVSDTDPDVIFVGVLDIWKSTDGGDNFAKINDWRTVNSTFTHADIHFMRYFNGDLYAGTDGGIYKSTNDGGSFSDLTEDISISQFYKVAVSKQSSNKLSGGLQDNGGFSLVNNQWYNYHGGDGMDSASDPNDENTFYGFLQFGGVLFATNDGGVTSRAVASRNTQGNWVTPLVINKGSEVYAGFNHLYKLNGNTWKKISNKFFGGNLDVVEIDPSNNNNIFVSRGLTLYKSTDRGDKFTTLNSLSTGIDGVSITSVEVHSTDSNIVWLTTTGSNNGSNTGSGDTGGGVYKSVDGGLTFTDISGGLPNEAKFVIRHHPFSTNNSIYVGTALGVYHKNDAVPTWEVYSTNLPNVGVSDLEINPYDNTLTAATYGRSVWQSPIESFPQPAIDADLLSVGPNVDIIGCGSELSPTITVLNNGLNNLSSLSINYKIDEGTDQTFDWTGSLNSNSSTMITLPSISFAGGGEHTISAELIVTDDTNNFNNSSSTIFSILPNSEGLIQTTYTFGDLNSGINENPSEWLVSDDNLWEIGTPTTPQLNNIVASGYVTNPSGNTPDQTISLLTSPCYNLSILENPELRFKMAFALEQNYDIVYVEYSTDQGASWEILGTSFDPNWYNSDRTNANSGAANDCQNCPGSQWTGTDTTLREYSYNLSALNSESNIVFRFKFVADPNTNDEGVVVDEFILDATKVLSVNDFDEGEFLIYPNPSSDNFNIKRFNTIGESMNLEVYDITGKLIRQKINIIDGDYELNMTGISKGIYFLQVSIDDKRLVKKLVLN